MTLYQNFVKSFVGILLVFTLANAYAQDCQLSGGMELPIKILDRNEFTAQVSMVDSELLSPFLNDPMKALEDCNKETSKEIRLLEEQILAENATLARVKRLEKKRDVIQNQLKDVRKNMSDAQEELERSFVEFYAQYGHYAIIIQEAENSMTAEDYFELTKTLVRNQAVKDLARPAMGKHLAKAKKEESLEIIKSFSNYDVDCKDPYVSILNKDKGYYLAVGAYFTAPTRSNSLDPGTELNVKILKFSTPQELEEKLKQTNATNKDIAAALSEMTKLRNLEKTNEFQRAKQDYRVKEFEDLLDRNRNEEKRLLQESKKLETAIAKVISIEEKEGDFNVKYTEALALLDSKMEQLETEWRSANEELIVYKDTVLTSELSMSGVDYLYSFLENQKEIINPKNDRKLFRIPTKVWMWEDNKRNVIVAAHYKFLDPNAKLMEEIATGRSVGEFTDVRDGQVYRWKKSENGVIWMIDNLNYHIEDSYCYNDDSTQCEKYGRLYSLDASMKACPPGWAVATEEEWYSLSMENGGLYDWGSLSTIGDSELSFKTLTAQVSDDGYNMLLGGQRSKSGYSSSEGSFGTYWTSTKNASDGKYWNYNFKGNYHSVGRFRSDQSESRSCRCVFSSNTEAVDDNEKSGFVKDDRDGQLYAWLRMPDGKKWMTKNLNYKIDDSWCHDDNEGNCNRYGRLYTWSAALNACPEGWRLPSDNDWWKMVTQYGGAYNLDNGQLENQVENAGYSAFKDLIDEGESGFDARLGGLRWADGRYIGHLGQHGYYWSRSEYSGTGAWHYVFSTAPKRIKRQGWDKSMGNSCRCIQD